MTAPPEADGDSKGIQGGAFHTVSAAQFTVGSLAWVQNTDQGFSTVNVSHVDLSTRRAFVEVNPEGARSVAAAEAAATVIKEAATGFIPSGSSSGNLYGSHDGMHRQHDNSSSPSAPQSGDTENHEYQSAQCMLKSEKPADESRFNYKVSNGTREPSPQVPVRDCAGSIIAGSSSDQAGILQQFSRKTISNFFTYSSSATALEHQVADAASAAADGVSSRFISQPPFEVPISNLWPYSAPPLPPHPMPDDSACCGTLSAAALLQLLQHRYLRDEIYTYAANVLLAVNPYKPLPYLYSAQQISLYRHWREIARVYRRQLNEDKAASTGGQQSGQADSATAIRSILDSLPGVLPVSRPPSSDASDFHTRTDSPELNPWMKGTAVSESRNLGTAIEQAFKETTASRNRPPPHPFVVAEEALRRLVGTQTSQTIVVSGQSGAGKTETSKQIMLFLTHVSTSPNDTLGGISGGAASSHSDSGAPKTVSGQRTEVAALLGGVQTLQEATELQKRIVSCNAIFESFGNAATRRNHNSSRIGRLTLLHFDSGGLLRGGSLRTYLLEASRITAHKRGDRNFHVFYQLLRGTTEELRSSMMLANDEEAYRMLRPSETHNFLHKLFSKEQNTAEPNGVDDAEDNAHVPPEVDQENFRLMVKGFQHAEFSNAEITELLQLLAGLLHLSNVSLTKDHGEILQLQDTASQEALKNASFLLGLEEERLKILLQCRCMLLKGDTLFTHRNEQQSASTRCSLIKFIYSRLFDHIVRRLNECAARHLGTPGQQLEETTTGSKTIGILDIYGFESFGLENGLEQLCINYANERQQQLFVQQVIEEEVALYTREGVTSPAVAARNKLAHQRQNAEQEAADLQPSGGRTKQSGSFKADLELSLLSSLPDTPSLLRDLQEGVFRRLDDSCRLLAQGQARDDTHFWNGLFTYCSSSTQPTQTQKCMHHVQRGSQETAGTREQHILFCLKGANGMQAAEAAANGTLLQHLQQDYLASIGLVEHELENLVAKSTKSLLRHAMQQHEESQTQEGVCVAPAGGGQFSSITKRFLKSVKDLNQELQGPQMQLHFIRCFIPNGQMKPDKFERKTVLHQLQHSGTLALVDILHSGFPHRMPLRALAARLRKAFGPLVESRLQEQEEKVQTLLGQLNATQGTEGDSESLEQELRVHCRILETLKHWNPATARDRMLVSATLGLLPQYRPGSFICGVSLVCFKASVYGEAAALIAEPGQFFKTPKDVCRLITAIQRLRWRVAVCIILHVHPTLLWLQRRAFLMRKIKEAVVRAATKIILLRKHILNPLRERVVRRLSIRRGIRHLERMVLQHFRRVWRRFKKALAAAGSADTERAVWPSEVTSQSSVARNSLLRLGSHIQSDEIVTAACSAHHHPHARIHPWNTHIFPIIQRTEQGPMQCHHVAVILGSKVYGVDISAAFSSKGVQGIPRVPINQQASDVHLLPAVPLIEQQHSTPSLTGLPTIQVESSGEALPKVGRGGQPRVVKVAKHPLCPGLFLAVDSAANLLVASAECDVRLICEQNSMRRNPNSLDSTPFGEPSTCLPVLDYRAAGLSKLVMHQSDLYCSESSLSAPMGSPATSPRSDKIPIEYFSESAFNKDSARLLTQLTHAPLPPGKWLPQDLLHQVTKTPQLTKAHSAQAHPPTVRPLCISFAHPLRTDCAIVMCLLQANSKTNSNSDTSAMGKLIAVLVDLVRREPISWIPLFFASHDISICARRNAAFLQQLSESALSPSLCNNTGHTGSAADEHQSPRCHRPTTRNRSTMLSTVRLQPLWGSLWAVTGPSLLAVFSVNLRFLHHPPADCENQPCARDPPLRLLWNMSSVPRVKGMTLELADMWLTGCTYTRLAPPHLSSLTGTDPIIQALQMMPFGEAARSLEAKMQRLLLLSTADNLLLLLQWSERGGDPITSSGNLVLLDQITLPSPIMQFLRCEPEAPFMGACEGNDSQERTCRLLRVFPWEEDLLISKAVTEDDQSTVIDSSDSTSASSMSSNRWSGQVEGHRFQRSGQNKAKSRSVGSLVRDFPSYGIAIVLTNSSGIAHTLDDRVLQRRQKKTCLQGSEILAVASSRALSGFLVSLRRLHDGSLRLCLEDNKGNFYFVGQLDLQDSSGDESSFRGSRVHEGTS
ncbi:hypothetical protein EPH_0005320 [Eimeria praecox]|uniref:Myosin motor domain-containing protein n=1 Tax=Eimeria praecox TaxID=51316 RepID=U6G5H6_9EIME|nr:hypothetical protein EPH_0005320 [Eimeria praecox]